jgi:tryptophanyl-tRNA synthetase
MTQQQPGATGGASASGPGGPPVTGVVLFSESYYRQVLAEFGYTSFDLRQFDFTLAGLDPCTLNARYLCHHHGEQYLRAAAQRRIVTTGFGMSGVPHLATVSHILKMIELQRGGERCQIVLGDLDAYNGKARPYAKVRELAGQFREYSLRLGFDPRAGIVRSQEGYLPALEAMYLLGRYVGQADFDAAEEDNHGYYARRGLVDAAMTFRRALSLSLMAADFLALGQEHEAVLVMLGVDEHRYVRFAQQAQERLDQNVPLRADFALTAAYTRMVRGFGGHPKFSKSIPGSALDMATRPEDVHRLLAAEPPSPEQSATYQLMCQVPRYDATTLLDLHAHCREGGPAWQRAVREFAEYVIDLIMLWPR